MESLSLIVITSSKSSSKKASTHNHNAKLQDCGKLLGRRIVGLGRGFRV